MAAVSLVIRASEPPPGLIGLRLIMKSNVSIHVVISLSKTTKVLYLIVSLINQCFSTGKELERRLPAENLTMSGTHNRLFMFCQVLVRGMFVRQEYLTFSEIDNLKTCFARVSSE